MRNILKNFVIFFIVFLIIASFFSLYSRDSQEIEEIGIQTLVTQISEEKVDRIEVAGSSIDIFLKDGSQQKAQKETMESFGELLTNYNADPEKVKNLSITIKDETGFKYWATTFLPFLLPFLFIGGFIYFMFRQAQGMNSKAMSFGQVKPSDSDNKEKKPKVTFKDVAGAKEAKEELVEVVEFLKKPEKFISLGAKIPKGVLLMGAPGTGKTLLAKAISGEAEVPFFRMSGSEFVEMFVGVGASRVRDLFKKAKRNSPCIIFIDEIDAVGRQRGAGLGGSHDEREQTLNQILVEMDGFDTNTNVIVIAATNRPDVLDPALLRPGRFDRRIVIDMPDINDRESILKVHAKGKPIVKDVNLRRIAERTPGFSGADLANLLNETAILAARKNKKHIDFEDIVESIDKVMMGPERKSHILSKQEKKITAYHEAGHALVAHMLPNADPVHKVSIVSRGRAAGYTLKLPIEDKHLHTRSEFIDDLAVLLAGHTAEKNIFGEVTTGATNDLSQATKICKQLIMQFGMSDNLTPRTFGNREELIFLGREITEQRNYSEKTAEKIDTEISKLINTAIETAQNIIEKHKDKLDLITEVLLKKETIERDEFDDLLSDKPKKEDKKGEAKTTFSPSANITGPQPGLAKENIDHT